MYCDSCPRGFMAFKVIFCVSTEGISFEHWRWDSGVYGEERTD